MAIAGLAAAFTALYYANRVAKPIAALTRTAEQIAGGDLSQRAHIRSRNEIGLLAQAFNSMAEQLQEFIGSLENRVAARTRDLALTLEVGHLATSLYTQKDLLTSLVNFIRDQFDLYYTQIYLLDEAGLHAVLRAGTGEVGQQLLARNHRLNLSETSLVARAVQTNQPVLVADTQTSAIHKANPLLPDTRSEVTIPLVVGGVIIGVLDMQSNREGTFNQENLPVFEAMASQIASALRGSQAFEEAQAAIQRAEMVNRRLTEETWDSYLGQLGEGRCLGYQYDLEAPRPLEPHSNGHDDGSRIVQPVFLRGQPIGKIVIAEDTERQWKPEEMLLVEDVAKRVAQALDQFRAFDQIKQAEAETRKRAAELQTVAEVSAATTTLLEIDDLLLAVSDLTKERFGLYHAHIYLLDEAGENLVLAAGAGEAGRIMKTEGRSIPLNHPHSLVAGAAREHKGVVVNDVTRTPDFLPNPLLPDTKSEMAVPMLVGDQLIGVLDVQASVTDRFTSEDVRVKTTLAAQVAVAVQNARAYMQTKQQAAIIETSRDFISLADLNGKILYVNPGGLEMVSRKSFADTNIADFYPEDEYRRIEQEALPTALQVGYWRGEVSLRKTDGSTLPADETILVVRDADGIPTNFATIITDISERKQAQAVLEENEARFRSLVSNVPGIIYRCAIDEFWTMQFIGPAIADLTGYPDTDFIQNNVRSYASVIHPDDTAKVDEAVWRGVENRMPYEIEYRLVHADGTVRWVNERGQAVYGQDGTPLWLDGAVFDITESKRAEAEREQLLAEMQRNARLIRTVIDATPDWIFAKDRDYRYILANQGYANAIGTTTDGIVGKTDVELGFPEEIVFGNPDKGIRGFRSDDEAVLTTGESIYNPYDPATFADGSIHIFDTQKMPLRDAAGHTFAVLGFARDITLRQQQEEEVRLAREEAEILYKVSSAINEAKNLLEIVDAILAHAAPPVEPSVAVTNNDTGDSTTARYVNILAGRLSDGRTISNMSIALDDFGSGFSAPNELRCIADIETDPSLTEEARWFYRALNAASVLSAPLEIGGRVVGTLSITTGQPYHYTERDRRIYTAIAEQVAAAMERLQLIQETQKRATEMETVARVSAATTTILDVEELLQAVCDLTKERFRLYHTHIYLLDETGQKLMLAAGAGDAGRIMKAEGRFIPINNPNSLVARAARERRGIIANDVTQEPDFLANPLLPLTQSELAVPMIVASELIGVLDVQSEILSRFTEEDVRIKITLADQVSIAIQNARAFKVQQEAAERLREVDRLKSQFLANMSHELRTPLNSIIGYAEVMLDGIDGELTDDAIEDVEAIHSGGKHLLAIINDILDLAKIDAGQMFMDRQEADLGKIIEEVVHTCQILVKDKGIYLELERQAELPPVYGDPVRLRQIVYNLVNNAIKFTEKGGITVSVGRQDDQQICVTVKDTGIGMSQKDLSVIFERFRQVDGSATRRAGGTGLGLAITRQLVQMHDGEIHVTSKPHEGSTFWFTLPVYEGQKA
ncbi:MAG: GAF domain-containing protein [Chloroflexi bacterium]|nr:GAF domain-containing protein [Chloroflexota bacterium]MDL1882433.1 GAF domain-containing protein [Anaerolineae bacterium CFX8]